jgi:hypothetical protein
LILVLEMVRRRRLREQYAWIWLLTAVGYLSVAAWPDLAVWVAKLIGASSPAATFTFFGLLFLFLLCIQFSVQLSRLAERNKDLAQHVAILDGEVRRNSAAGSRDSELGIQNSELETRDSERGERDQRADG